MEYAEQESLISELETKIERLRALYDQYFMGFEKIEPLVQRKDVERKLYILRREQIRNTALRFRFNQVVSRYNTFGTHWQRILREIENGTYKRDVARAAKRFGTEALTIQARRRLKNSGTAEPASEAAPESSVPVPSSVAGTPPSVAGGAVAAARVVAAPASSQGARRAEPPWEPPAEVTLDLTAPPSGPRGATAPARAAPRLSKASTFQRLDLDTDDLEELTPPRGTPSPVAAARPAAPARTAPSPAPPVAAPPVRRVEEAPAPRAPVSPAQPAVAAKLPAPAANAPVARPAPPTPTPAAAKPILAAPASPDAISERRLRELYGKLVETKRQCNESTAGVSVDGLTRSLRESQQRLREKHAGKEIDFDVVVKDGRAVVRPIIR